ncbi:MAG: type II secretion system F family protein [Kiritimatiellae bacterium]|nr:type II secretion system F family protein [Kiritimatiellia bacterium]
MSGLELGMAIAWAIAISAFAAYAESVAKEVTYVTLADGRRQERSLPLIFKLLLPFTANFNSLLEKPIFKKQIERAEPLLVSAGFEGLLGANEFVALKILVPLAMGIVWSVFILLIGGMVPGSIIDNASLPLCVFGFALFMIQPSSWLRAQLKKRHLSIMKALPFVLDMLTLSVEAGMDFISALQRNVGAKKLDPLNEELLRMTKEIQVGLSRKEALRRMADRVNQQDLRSIAFALIQADELGASIGSILRIQSEQLRAQRFDRAEKLANEAPTKMLAPLMLCIFPAVFIILLGPVLSQALKGLM